MTNLILNKHLTAALKAGIRYGISSDERILSYVETVGIEFDGRLINDPRLLADFRLGCSHYLVTGIHKTEDGNFEVTDFHCFPDGYSTGFDRLSEMIRRGAEINLLPMEDTVAEALGRLYRPWEGHTNALMSNELRKSMIDAFHRIIHLESQAKHDESIDITHEPIIATYRTPDGTDYFIIMGRPCSDNFSDMILSGYSKAFSGENNYFGNVLLSELNDKYCMRELSRYYTIMDAMMEVSNL